MLGLIVEGALSYGPTILASIGAAVVARRIYNSIDFKGAGERISRVLLTSPIFERVPLIGRHIRKEKETLRRERLGLIKSALETRGIGTSPEELRAYHKGEVAVRLPDEGMPLNEIAEELGISEEDLAAFRRAAEARVARESEEASYASGAIYTRNVELYILSMMVDCKYSYSNHMHSDIWPELLEYRAKLINWIGNLLHAPSSHPVQGIATAGGTLSIFESVNAHLQLYLKSHPGVDRSRLCIMGSVDTHEAFRKACLRLGIQFIEVPVRENRQVNVEAMEKECTRLGAPTPIMLVANQIAFPYGIADNVEEVSELARKLRIGCHVDMCLGSIYEADLEGTKEGFVFDHPGVTAASFDTHKFCEVDKGGEGSSVVIFRNAGLKISAAHSGVDWEGGAYATAHAPGSVGGAGIAKAYFTMLLIGRNEYQKRRDRVFAVTEHIKSRVKDGIQTLVSEDLITEGEFFVVGDPKHAVVGFSGSLAHAVANLLKHNSYKPGSKEYLALGFSEEEPTDDQLWLRSKPRLMVNDLKGGFHQCTTMAYAAVPDFAEMFVGYLVHAIHVCKAHPDFVKNNSTAAFYCTAAKVPSVAKWALHDLAKEYTRLEGLTAIQLVQEYRKGLEVEESVESGASAPTGVKLKAT